jgi:hypothetical protein
MLISIVKHLLLCGLQTGHHHYHPPWAFTIKNYVWGHMNNIIGLNTVKNKGERKVVISNLPTEVSAQNNNNVQHKTLHHKSYMKIKKVISCEAVLSLRGEAEDNSIFTLHKPLSWSSNTQRGCIWFSQFKQVCLHKMKNYYPFVFLSTSASIYPHSYLSKWAKQFQYLHIQHHYFSLIASIPKQTEMWNATSGDRTIQR